MNVDVTFTAMQNGSSHFYDGYHKKDRFACLICEVLIETDLCWNEIGAEIVLTVLTSYSSQFFLQANYYHFGSFYDSEIRDL